MPLEHSPIQPPALRTLHQPASWLNAKGNIDRSACIEIRVSEARRLAGCAARRQETRSMSRHKPGPAHPLPNEQPAPTFTGRVATGVITITADHLMLVIDHRPPRRIAGDFRTARAPAMRPERRKPGFKTRINRRDPIAFPPDRGLEPNPNHGASRTKKIGIRVDWSQPVRLEQWNFPTRIRPAYFFICPGHAMRAGKCEPPFLAPLSTCGAGRKDPSTKRCPQRCLKLMMVQCTKAELADAEAAQLWIDSLPPQHVPHMRSEIALLRARYGPIMPPRVLLCPRCLGVKYGNHPETVRQGWRRRNGKEDTRVHTALLGPKVRERAASVDARLCTPLAGQIEHRLRELYRYKRYNYFKRREKPCPPSRGPRAAWAQVERFWRNEEKRQQREEEKKKRVAEKKVPKKGRSE